MGLPQTQVRMTGIIAVVHLIPRTAIMVRRPGRHSKAHRTIAIWAPAMTARLGRPAVSGTGRHGIVRRLRAAPADRTGIRTTDTTDRHASARHNQSLHAVSGGDGPDSVPVWLTCSDTGPDAIRGRGLALAFA